MIKYSKSRMQVYLTKKEPVTVYNVKIIAKDGSYCNYSFTYARYHEERLLKRSERKAIKLLAIEHPDFDIDSIKDIKTRVIKNSITIKSNPVSIPKGTGVAKFGEKYWLYTPINTRKYQVRVANISYDPPIAYDKLIVLDGNYNKLREHRKIVKALDKDEERLVSFKLIERTTKKIEHEVKFTWPQEDKI